MRKLVVAAAVTFALAPPAFAKGKKQAQAAPPNDAQIAAIVVASNRVDINAGKLATKKALSPDVKQFAETMVTDHTKMNKEASELVHKLRIKPRSNATSKSLEKGGKANLARLRKLKGAAFDKAYIEHEVAYHEEVLKTIDDTLLPHVKNAELKALIVKVRPVIAEHLDHAKTLQQQLQAMK